MPTAAAWLAAQRLAAWMANPADERGPLPFLGPDADNYLTYIQQKETEPDDADQEE
jgi:hypothetical protein